MSCEYSLGDPQDSETKGSRHLRTALMVLFVVVVLLAAIIGLSLHFQYNDHPVEVVNDFDPAVSLLGFFQKNDGLDVIWKREVNTQVRLTKSLIDDTNMIDGTVQLRGAGSPNQEVYMANITGVTTELSLADFLDKIIKDGDKGVKLNFPSLDAANASLSVLKDRKNRIEQPVWLHADVIGGDGSDTQPVDAQGFFELVQASFPNATLSLGWVSGCCTEPYTEDVVKKMLDVTGDTANPVSFSVRSALVKDSWSNLRWLWEQDPARFSFTIRSPAGDSQPAEEASTFDLLCVRNDIPKKAVYYELDEDQLEELRSLSVTAGNPMNHFDVGWDAVNITWSEPTSSPSSLQNAIKGAKLMLKGKVLLDPMSNEAVMGPSWELPLSQWLTTVVKSKSKKGINLVVDDADALVETLQLIQNTTTFRQPVWLQADVFQGPNGQLAPVDSTEFQEAVFQYTNKTTLVLGWTSGISNDPFSDVYTDNMMSAMMSFAKTFQQPIVFRVRASLALRSWKRLQALLDESRGYKLLLWADDSDFVDPDDLVYIRRKAGKDRVFFDIPEATRKDLLDRLD